MNLNDRRLDVQMFALLAAMVALWTLACGLSHTAPDLDGMEELVWASSLELGYMKHPPFPSWVMYFLTQVFGRPVWLAFFAGQLASATALWFLWLLGKQVTSPRNAFIAVLVGSTNLYFSMRGTIYNHNTAQLWSVVASTWFFYLALERRQTRYWIGTGMISGLAMITKYSALIQLFAFFMVALRLGELRKQSTWKGIGWASLAFALVVMPNFLWLISKHFAPLTYTDDSLVAATRAEAMADILGFCLDQLARLSPMAVVWLVWWLWQRKLHRRTPAPGLQTLPTLAANIPARTKSFLLWAGLTPVVSTVIIGMIVGTPLSASWGTTFFVLWGFYFLWAFRGDNQTIKQQVTVIVIAVHVLMAVGYALGRGPLAWYAGHNSRSTFPGPQIATQMAEVWSEHVPGTPLLLVASDRWLGGNIAIHTSFQTQVFINASFAESPWLNPDTALDCGVLIVHSQATKAPLTPELLRLFNQGHWSGVAQQRWSSDKSPMIDLNWSIIPPNERCHAKRR
jgi:hypothetical protein